jgi:adenylate cyclase class IV
VKLRLSKEAHDKLVSILATEQQHLYQQENFFFDGPNQELTSRRCVMRLRFFNTDEKAVITVKGKMAVTDGVGRAQEDEAAVDPVIARGYAKHPNNASRVDVWGGGICIL